MMRVVPDIESPVTGRPGAHRVDTVPVAQLVRRYRTEYGVDVGPYFHGMEQISIYECSETSYRFFYPYSLAGDSAFYERLATNPEIYPQDRWEHTTALEYVRPGHRLLDVGCGPGYFLRRAERLGAEACGLELNVDAANKAKQLGIDVRVEQIQEHGRTAYYNVVTAFQVLEHIPQVRQFLQACLRALRPNGLLILGVPNNESFIRFADMVLNYPPHHMGLWTKRSLKALGKIYSLDVVAMELEPLSTIEFYRITMEHRYIPKRWMRSIYYRLGGAERFQRYLEDNASSIAGHTILVVFRKEN